MGKNKLILYVHTVKYLKLKQVYYQIFYKLRNKFFKKNYKKQLDSKIEPLQWDNSIRYSNSFKQNNSFTFLNIEHKFINIIDWNFGTYGKLWTYNLNYFDFLNQEQITTEEGLILIKEYLKNDNNLIDGKEPYPISLRGINWIKFLSKNRILNNDINQTLYNHYQILLHNLEYHLLGNHLLENGYSLFFGAYYFKDDELYKRAKLILTKELAEQILEDGAHFELSPMYHQILLHRLLDCICLAKTNVWNENKILDFLLDKATKMLSWLQTITYSNGNVPMVNDSAYGISLSSNQLFKYADSLGLKWEKVTLSDSGYRKFKERNYELFVDVGNIGPKYQPGHAHSDTFSFELYKDEIPILVDTGTSTYEKNNIRLLERGTTSHNTVKIGGHEQSKIWDGFRVAQRAEIVKIKDGKNQVEATHNGYKNIGFLHTRSFFAKSSHIIIEDSISSESKNEQIAFFHFHPNIKEILILGTKINLPFENIEINFSKGALKIQKENYEYALGFNKRQKAIKIKVYFNGTLSTKISI